MSVTSSFWTLHVSSHYSAEVFLLAMWVICNIHHKLTTSLEYVWCVSNVWWPIFFTRPTAFVAEKASISLGKTG